ncbi:alpha/beta fold hydrolase [Micromonospora sp. DT229]|uniref:alpha/beta fold hydrolase n=1 Tax=Micromonospora sp. DT229 TaxID=3393430 RepID=UPI003CF07F58
MGKAISADGTPIGYDQRGDGPPVVLVTGALGDRDTHAPLANALARRFTVFTYDRRGRGQSGDLGPYEVDREIEDLAAIITEAGGSAAVYGHSSGAGLAMRAAASGLPIDRLILHEAPYGTDDEDERRDAHDFAVRLRELLAERRSGDAVALFMETTGTPPDTVAQWRTESWWPTLEARAHTLAYDSAVMGDEKGGGVPTDLIASVRVPTLVLSGGDSFDFMRQVADRITELLPDGRHRVVEGQGHNVPAEVLAPVLISFLDGQEPG